MRYNGGVCKNNQGSLKSISKRQNFKEVEQYSAPGNDRDYVTLVKNYIDLLPETSDDFYMKPILNGKNGNLSCAKLEFVNSCDTKYFEQVKFDLAINRLECIH